MRRSLNAAVLLTLLVLLSALPVRGEFSDVPAGGWYREAVTQMAEEGLLGLDDPVSQYVPEFTNKNQKTVTIRHLMSHCGGFFPLPRILVGQVAESLGLKESETGDFAYNDAIASEGVRLVAQRLDEQTMESGLNGARRVFELLQ